jgi:hypothetical protein
VGRADSLGKSEEGKGPGISFNFRRILRFVSGLIDLSGYQLDDSVIEDKDLIYESGGIESRLYQRIECSLTKWVEPVAVFHSY